MLDLLDFILSSNSRNKSKDVVQDKWFLIFHEFLLIYGIIFTLFLHRHHMHE